MKMKVTFRLVKELVTNYLGGLVIMQLLCKMQLYWKQYEVKDIRKFKGFLKICFPCSFGNL